MNWKTYNDTIQEDTMEKYFLPFQTYPNPTPKYAIFRRSDAKHNHH